MGGHTALLQSQAWKSHPALVHKFEALDVSLNPAGGPGFNKSPDSQKGRMMGCSLYLFVCACGMLEIPKLPFAFKNSFLFV